MTAKERARLHGFWTHKKTGQRIAISRVTLYGEAHARKVNSLGHEVTKGNYVGARSEGRLCEKYDLGNGQEINLYRCVIT